MTDLQHMATTSRTDAARYTVESTLSHAGTCRRSTFASLEDARTFYAAHRGTGWTGTTIRLTEWTANGRGRVILANG